MTKPSFIYGTAWKEERTAELTYRALQAGFRAIDTANQRKHYFEEGAGSGIAKFIRDSELKRQDLFIQTKFTFSRGQDHRKPYQDSDPFSKQVTDSFASSLQHLQTDYIDSYVLHGPYSSEGISEPDLAVWAAMENLYRSKKILNLGVSNVSPEQLMLLCKSAQTQPQFVQNRCYARLGWDRKVRQICQDQKITYQGFSLLTANRSEIASPLISEIAKKHNKNVEQVIFKFCRQLNMICLTGTSNIDHMRTDLEIEDFELTFREISVIESISI